MLIKMFFFFKLQSLAESPVATRKISKFLGIQNEKKKTTASKTSLNGTRKCTSLMEEEKNQHEMEREVSLEQRVKRNSTGCHTSLRDFR